MKLKTKEWIDFFVGNILIAINVIPVRILGLLIKRDHSLKQNPSTIIFTKLLGLGSLLMAADSVLAIRKKYPSSRIVLICSKSISEEVRVLSLFDEVWQLDDSGFTKMLYSFFEILMKSWKSGSRWTVNLEVYSRLTTILSVWTFSRNRFGFYFSEVKFRHLLNTHHVYFNQMLLVYTNYEQMANAMNAEVNERFVIPLRSVNSNKENTSKYFAINNNCSELAKERILPPAIMGGVIRKLLKEYEYNIYLIGSKVDYISNEDLINNYGLQEYSSRIKNIAGIYSFSEYLNILQNSCLLMLTIDSAPLHISYRLNLPTVSLWGPTNPITRVPEMFQHEIIYLHPNCSPCVHHVNILPCGGDNFCMKNITELSIIAAIKKELNQKMTTNALSV